MLDIVLKKCGRILVIRANAVDLGTRIAIVENISRLMFRLLH